jgi:hypothetical protein
VKATVDSVSGAENPNHMAKHYDLETILTTVRAGQFDELVGVVEGANSNAREAPIDWTRSTNGLSWRKM